MENKERDSLKREIALFRYGLIAPVVTDTFEEKSQIEYFRNAASKVYNINGRQIKLATSTIKNWYLDYKKNGFNALLPKTRCDINSSRKLSNEAMSKIISLKKEFPHISGTLIYQKLNNEGYINEFDVSLSTVLKFIRDNKLLFNETENEDRRAFVMEFSNDCWQADTSHGPYLTINKKKVLTYLIAIIDDASRLIVSAKFYFNDNAVNFQNVFKNAVKTYGIPKKLFVDNGSTYKNDQLSLICANTGTILIHARPYSGASKAKIERWFHTMKATWMRGLKWDEIKNIDELNNLLKDFVNLYNNKIHSSLKDDNEKLISPNTRWFKDVNKIKKIDNNLIDTYFLHTAYPRIRYDAIAYIKGYEFEVNMKYIGKKIIVKYNPEDMTKAWIYEENKSIEEIKLVNKIDNSKVKRKTTIY